MIGSYFIGVLSDTHGHLPQFVRDGLTARKVTHIFHAGDIGDPSILAELKRIAPTSWVHGNMDSRSIGDKTTVAEVGGTLWYVLHNLYDIDLVPSAADICAVVHGHLHRPNIEWREHVLYINPGSCSYPRGGHPPSYAIVEVRQGQLHPQIVYKND